MPVRFKRLNKSFGDLAKELVEYADQGGGQGVDVDRRDRRLVVLIGLRASGEVQAFTRGKGKATVQRSMLASASQPEAMCELCDDGYGNPICCEDLELVHAVSASLKEHYEGV